MLCLLMQLTEILCRELFCAKLALKIVELQMFCFNVKEDGLLVAPADPADLADEELGQLFVEVET
jgi:hypothetical protein